MRAKPKRMAWKSQVTTRWPATGGDEFHRTTMVLPWPFKTIVDPEDGYKSWWAVIVVVLPWWANRWNRKNAAYVYHQRLLYEALYYVDENAETEKGGRWDKIFDAFHEVEPKVDWDV